ncbi:sce7725 family protein [Acinetobacter sp. ANC 5383]
MYYPILRGKRSEFLAIKELLENTDISKVVPIIEPVRSGFSELIAAIKTLNGYDIEPLIIVNPNKGDFNKKHTFIYDQLLAQDNNIKFIPCLDTSDEKYLTYLEKLDNFSLFTNGITDEVVQLSHKAKFTFVGCATSETILDKMNSVILYGDFFQSQKRNADYPQESYFSDLHTSFYNKPNAVGFADYTITGKDFSDSGGPAVVVTIHASYLKDANYDQMFVRHYLSYDDGEQKNPGDKFKDALEKFITEIEAKNLNFEETFAISKFKNLHLIKHFPGLGQVKKLSMMHHIETINNYLD